MEEGLNLRSKTSVQYVGGGGVGKGEYSYLEEGGALVVVVALAAPVAFV